MFYKLMVFTLICGALWAAPSNYQIRPLSIAPTIDGNISEWTEDYFLDSLHNGNNVLYAHDASAWTRNEIQYIVYGAYDENKIYFAIKVIADDAPTRTGAVPDHITINPGGQAMACFLTCAGVFITNPSSPFELNQNTFVGTQAQGNGEFPTYEIAVNKSAVDPFESGSFSLLVGTWDADNDGTNDMGTGIGVEYTGNKLDDSNNPWDNPMYYPTYNLLGTEGSPIAVENALFASKNANTLNASPNPSMPATTLVYTSSEKGSLSIYAITGQMVKSFPINPGSGKIQWDAKDMSGKVLSAGIYIAKLGNSKSARHIRLFLER